MENEPQAYDPTQRRKAAISQIASLMVEHGIDLTELQPAVAALAPQHDSEGADIAPAAEDTQQPDEAVDSSAGETALDTLGEQWARYIRSQGQVMLTGKFDKGFLEEPSEVGRYSSHRKTKTPTMAIFETIHLLPPDENSEQGYMEMSGHTAPISSRLINSAVNLQRYMERDAQPKSTQPDVLLLTKERDDSPVTYFAYATAMTAESSLDGRTKYDPMALYGQLPSDVAGRFYAQVREQPELIVKVYEHAFKWLVDRQWLQRRPADALGIVAIYSSKDDIHTESPYDLGRNAVIVPLDA